MKNKQTSGTGLRKWKDVLYNWDFSSYTMPQDMPQKFILPVSVFMTTVYLT